MFSPRRRSASAVASQESQQKRRERRARKWRERFRRFSLSTWQSSRIVQGVCNIFRSGAETARAVRAATGSQVVGLGHRRSLSVEPLEARQMLSNTPWNLAAGDLQQDWSNVGLIATNDDWSGVPSIVGYLGDVTPDLLTGTNPQTVLSPGSGTADAIANQQHPAGITDGGVAEFHTAPAMAFADNFDSYANQASFEAVWSPIAGTAPISATLSTAQASSETQSAHVAATTVTGQQRNRATIGETGSVLPGDQLIFSFDFYDAAPAAAPYRQFSNLQDGASPSGTNQLVSMGLSNNQTGGNSGGQFYMARILGYTVPITADPDGGPAETVGGASAFFKLNDFGAGARSAGWHNLKVIIITNDGLSTDYEFYVDNVLAERVANVGTAASIRSYDNIALGSGLSNHATGGMGTEAYFDNMNVQFIPGPPINSVVALQGSGTADAPFLNVYANSTGRQNVSVSYNLRDVDVSTDNSVQPVALQYRIGGSGNYTNVPSAFVADASSGPNQATLVTAVSASLPEWNNVADLQFRIITTNAAGSDEWIGIDDIVVSSTAVVTTYVDDDWASFTSGQIIADADPNTPGDQRAEFGFDAFASVQAGIDALGAPGVVNVRAGTYSGNVDATSKSVTFVPGASPGQVVINGDLVMDGDDELAIEIDGLSPASPTEFDNVIVTGTATLGGAALSVSGSYISSIGESFLIINGVVNGTFSNGSVALNGIPLSIDYSSVTLSVEPPAEVWVDNDWFIVTDIGPVGLSYGDLVESDADDGDAAVSGKVFGYNAYATISDGVVGVEDAGTVHVLAGTFAESLSIAKDVTIDGQSDADTLVDAGGEFTGITIESGYTVEVSGIEVSNFSSNGIHVQGDLILADSTITGGLTGTWVDGGSLGMSSTLISGSVIFGVQVGNSGTANIASSEITGTGTTAAGVIVSSGSAEIVDSKLNSNNRGLLVNATGSATVTGSDLSGNTIGGVVNATATAVDASGNWWGSNVEAAVDAAAVGTVDFTPFLNVATDTGGGARGFAGDFSLLHVTALGDQTGVDSRIQEGVDDVDTGGTVFVHNGIYTVSNTLISQSLTVEGESRSGVVLAPAIEDSNNSGLFDGTAVHAFLIQADDVTITTLTIDGEANASLTPGRNNFRTGVLMNSPVGAFDNLTVDSVDVLNIYRRGIQISSSGVHTTGHVVTNNLVDDIELAGGGYGIAVFEADALVAGNTVRNAALGIATNYIFSAANAGVVTIQGNTIDNTDIGIYASGLAGGSLVGGPTLSERNNIDLTQSGGTAADLGIIVDYVEGTVTVQNNEVLASAGDSAIWLYHNELVGSPVQILDNVLTATGSTRSGAGEGVGIFSTDNGVFNGDEDGDSYAVIRGNTITNFVGGIELDRSGTSPVGGRNVVTTIGGPSATDKNQISGTGAAGTFGILVFEIDGAANGGFRNVATIQNNGDSIHGFDIGIDVDGGSATISGNHIYDNTTGIRFTNGGTGNVDDNIFEGGADPDNATDLRIDATAGGITGGVLTANIFAGTTYIDNQSPQDLTALRIGSGNPADDNVYKRDNVTVETNDFNIEGRVYHEIDDSASGLVTWVADTIFVTPTATPTVADNDYTRIVNALEAASAGDTILLGPNGADSVFNWDEVNALASWELGNDATSSTDDDWGAMLPAGLNNVTVTASLVDGITIQGPGDLTDTSIETGFLAFGNGTNTGWTFSNFSIFDIDNSIGLYYFGGDDFSGLTIDQMHIRVPADNTTETDDFQNIGIHYGFGQNIHITNNTIDLDGAGAGASVGIQSNTHAGAAYDGLLIDDNTISVLNAGNEVILGIWENGHTHGSNITVSNNDFINLDPGNDPTSNQQKAFRVTSHSSALTTVTYSGNTVDGANIGFEWLASSNFAGNEAIELSNNILTNVNTGMLVQSNGVAHLSGNSLTNSGTMEGVGTGIDVAAGSIVSVDGSPSENTIIGFSTGIRSAGTVTVEDNDASIRGNVIGIDVTGGTATISGNHIYDNATGVRFSGGGGSVTGNNFNDALVDAGEDNATDLVISATAGSVTIGAGNAFAGDNYFIDNTSTQPFNLFGANAQSYEGDLGVLTPGVLADDFRIEDKMFHGPDNGLAGVVYWVAGTMFVTAPATGNNDEKIQWAINTTAAGNTVNVEAGTYTENITITKDINLLGEVDGFGVATTNLQPAVLGNVIAISGSGFGDNETVNIENFNLNGLAGLGVVGVSVASSSDFAKLSVTNGDFTGFNNQGILVGANSITGLSVQDVELAGLTFSNNGLAGFGGTGDVAFDQYNGDATLTDLTLVGSATATVGARLGIQFRGTGDAAGVGVQSSGIVSFDNVDISGDYRTNMISIQRYSDVSDITFDDVALGGVGSSITGTFGAALRFDGVGDLTSKGLPGEQTIDLGNTYFRGLDSYGVVFDIEFAPDNTFAWVRADGTDTRWNTTTGPGVNIAAGDLSIAQAYEVEDRILHYVEPDHPSHLKPFKGFVEIQDGHAFVTSTYASVINRAVEMVDANGTVHVADGAYTQSVDTSPKSVTLSLGASPGQATINGNVTLDGDDTLLMEINGLAAGTQHDKLVVNGMVTLGGATLSTTGSTISASNGQSVTIIENDDSDPVGGIFDTLANGATLMINSQLFQIFYDGGDGNDVVLVRIPTAPPPDVVFVDDDWSIYSNGFDADGGGGGTLGNGSAIGYDQFDTIQEAIDAVAMGGTIYVYAGMYGETLTIDKALDLISEDAVFTTAAGDGDADSIIDPSGTNAVIVEISVSDVELAGFTVEGDSTDSYGILATHPVDTLTGLEIHHNAVRNLLRRGIQSDTYLAEFDIHHNRVSNITGDAAAIAIFNYGGGGLPGTAEIHHNTITGSTVGIGGQQSAGMQVHDNDITMIAGGVGIQDSNPGTGSPPPIGATETFNDNIISGGDSDSAGLIVINSAMDVLIKDNTVATPGTGLGAFGSFSPSVITFDHNTVEADDVGIHITTDTLGLNGFQDVSAIIQNDNEIWSAATGILVEELGGADADVTITDNDNSIHDNAIGIDVVGGSVIVTNNDIHDNGIGIRLSDATGDLTNNDIYSNYTGIDVRGASTLTLTGGTVNDNDSNGLSVIGNGSVQSITVVGTSFSSNSTGQPVSAGHGDITLFDFSGPTGMPGSPSTASFTGVTINSDMPDYAIQVRGRNGDIAGSLIGLNVGSTAEVSFDNVDILGTQQRFGMLIQQYADLSGFSFNDVTFDSVALGGLVIFDAAGSLNLGDTTFHDGYTGGDGIGNGTGFDIATSLNNIDATGVTFLDSSDVALDKTDLQDNFAIEDRVAHAIDVDAPGPLVTGFVDWVDSGAFANSVFLTTESWILPFSTAASVQRAIDVADAVATKDTLNIQDGTYTDTAQVVIDTDVTVIGEDKTSTILTKNFNTAGSGDGRGWWLVNEGIDLNLSHVGFDGSGQLTWQAIRHKGTGTIDNVAFDEIKFNESGPHYAGTAVAHFPTAGGNLDVTNSTFSEIGRVGVLYFGAGVTGTFQDNTYTGKGAGDWLDYGVEVGAGAVVGIIDNNISNNLGIASVDSSESGGVLVTTLFGGGSEANLSGDNNIAGNLNGVLVGFDAADTSVVTINDGDIINNMNVGVLVVGGSLSISGGAVITGNGVGVGVNDANALVQGADLTNNTIGVRLENGAIVDLGQAGAPSPVDYTGLGISTGGNDFSTYTAAASATSGAIVNLNTGGAYLNAGPQGHAGPEHDVAAFGNSFNPIFTTPGQIDTVIWHDADDTDLGFVDHASLANLVVSLDPLPGIPTINENVTEGTTATVYGSFTNDAQAHKVTVTWGDGSLDTVMILNAGVFTFEITSNATTTYTDDPNGSLLQTIHRLIQVKVEEVANPGNFDTDNSLSVDVNNVIPVVPLVDQDGDNTINEGQTFNLEVGPVVDPGTDTILAYEINWGDGTTTFVPGVPLTTMAVHSHLYADGVVPPERTITIDVQDDDGTWATVGSLEIQVHNVNPTATAFLTFDPVVDEGDTTTVFFVGPFADPGSPDTPFHFSYDFNGNGIYGEAGEIGDGSYSGSPASMSAAVPASFLADDDDSPRTVKGRIIDNDGGFTEYSVVIAINNVAPVVDAGADTTVFPNTVLNHVVSFTDPGADSPWTVRVDWDGVLGFDETFNVPSHSFNIADYSTWTYDLSDVGTTFMVTVEVDDNDGGVDSDVFDVMVVEDTLRVIDFQTNHSGFDATFNRAPNLADLNLYDSLLEGSPVTLDAADVTLIRNGSENILGSIVWAADTNTLSFVKTGGVLAAGNYSVTLLSGLTGFHDGLNVLDGDGDFDDNEVGDNFTENFVVATPVVDTRVVFLPDFARGAGQDVNVPATGLHLPIKIDNAAGVTAVDVDVLYDPTLLTITAASLGSGPLGAGGWSITTNSISIDANHTLLKITVSGITALAGSNVELIRLNSEVPNTAPYADSQAIRLQGLRVNEDLIASKADFAVHKAAYVGDADGDGSYGGTDAGLISRVVVALDSGFEAHDWTDPRIVGDASGDGTLSGLDASYVAQEAVFIDVLEVPPLPGILLVASGSGADPGYSIDENIHATIGGNVTVSVELNVMPAETVVGATFHVYFDESLLTFDSAATGDFWTTGDGWNIVASESLPGRVTGAMYNSMGQTSDVGQGVIANLDFSVSESATVGSTSELDVEVANPNEGGLMWTDDVDGSVLVAPALPGDYNRDNSVDAADYVVWRKMSGTTGLPLFEGADGNGDGDVDQDDYNVWRANFGSMLPPGSGASVASVASNASSASSAVVESTEPAIVSVTVEPVTEPVLVFEASTAAVGYASVVATDTVFVAEESAVAASEQAVGPRARDEALAGLIGPEPSARLHQSRSAVLFSRIDGRETPNTDALLIDVAIAARHEDGVDSPSSIREDEDADNLDAIDELFAELDSDALAESLAV